MAIMKMNEQITNVSSDMEMLEFVRMAGENVKYYSHCGKR